MYTTHSGEGPRFADLVGRAVVSILRAALRAVLGFWRAFLDICEAISSRWLGERLSERTVFRQLAKAAFRVLAVGGAPLSVFLSC